MGGNEGEKVSTQVGSLREPDQCIYNYIHGHTRMFKDLETNVEH